MIEWFLNKTWFAQVKLLKIDNKILLPEFKSSIGISLSLKRELYNSESKFYGLPMGDCDEFHITNKLKGLIEFNPENSNGWKDYKKLAKGLGLKALALNKALGMDGVPDEIVHYKNCLKYHVW